MKQMHSDCSTFSSIWKALYQEHWDSYPSILMSWLICALLIWGAYNNWPWKIQIIKYHTVWMAIVFFQLVTNKYLLSTKLSFKWLWFRLKLGVLPWCYVFLNFEVRFNQWTFHLECLAFLPGAPSVKYKIARLNSNMSNAFHLEDLVCLLGLWWHQNISFLICLTGLIILVNL